jgi:hypothetical protein
MATFLFDEFDIEASLATISRALKRATWSRKAVKARAAERSEPLRRVWQGTQKKYESS